MPPGQESLVGSGAIRVLQSWMWAPRSVRRKRAFGLRCGRNPWVAACRLSLRRCAQKEGRMLRFLVYHRITDNQRSDFRAIHPDGFRRHLEVIDAAGIPVIDPRGLTLPADLVSG